MLQEIIDQLINDPSIRFCAIIFCVVILFAILRRIVAANKKGVIYYAFCFAELAAAAVFVYYVAPILQEYVPTFIDQVSIH
ncbi:MAG: hypothetical protein K6F51_09605 [Acetatifactor sp.]|nr:hypothetical protein [Acetatifactor sp.]